MTRRGLRISLNPILKTTHPNWVLTKDEHLVNAFLCCLSYNNIPSLNFRWASIIAHNTSRNIPNLSSVLRDSPPIHRLLLMGYIFLMHSPKCPALIWAPKARFTRCCLRSCIQICNFLLPMLTTITCISFYIIYDKN